jgi:hypothetical protein
MSAALAHVAAIVKLMTVAVNARHASPHYDWHCRDALASGRPLCAPRSFRAKETFSSRFGAASSLRAARAFQGIADRRANLAAQLRFRQMSRRFL